MHPHCDEGPGAGVKRRHSGVKRGEPACCQPLIAVLLVNA